MTGWRNIIWALAATVALASPVFAQGGGASSTGSISGEIKDAQGGVLPGVTVTATSPAQIGALTAVTNEAGIYRFPAGYVPWSRPAVFDSRAPGLGRHGHEGFYRGLDDDQLRSVIEFLKCL